jgi:tryptophan-rich sensory protein
MRQEDLKFVIVGLFITISIILYTGRQPFWFSSLQKPKWLELKHVLMLMFISYILIYLLWVTHPEIEPYAIVLLSLTFLWFMIFFGVYNYRLSLVVLSLIGITLTGMLSIKTIGKEPIYWIYVAVVAGSILYNVELYLENTIYMDY